MDKLLRGKIRISIAILLASAALLFAGLYSGYENSRNPVRIGVLHSLTGTMATSETPLVDALRLAVEEANREGGIGGAQIEMIVADCRSDAEYCAQQADNLIASEGVNALFGCWTSACRKAVRKVVEKHDHLLFYPLQYEGMEKSPNIIYTGAAPNQQVIPMVSWAMQEHGKRAFLVGSDYEFPLVTNRIVKKLLYAKGGMAVGERYLPLGEKSMAALAREIKEKRPDFVLNTINGDSNLYFFRALQEAGISAEDIPVFSTSIAEVELAVIGPELMAGHYAAWNYFQSIDSSENRDFVERFRNRFGPQRVLDDPMEASYIAFKLWVNALRSKRGKDRLDINNVLAQQSLVAPEGIVAVDIPTHHLWKPVRIGRARADGNFDIVWQSERSIAPAPYPFFIPADQMGEVAGGAP